MEVHLLKGTPTLSYSVLQKRQVPQSSCDLCLGQGRLGFRQARLPGGRHPSTSSPQAPDHPWALRRRAPLRVESFAERRKAAMDVGRAPTSGEDATRPPPIIHLDSLKAVLLDIDGTLANSDPLHFIVFRDFLVEVGFQGGRPIDEEFFRQRISGRHNPDICADLFPSWDLARRTSFAQAKEERFRKLAAGSLQPVAGLERLCAWIKEKGLLRAAVTNADRANGELMISTLGLSDFFDLLVIGNECKRAKPFPDPYQRALDHFKISASEAFIVEDSPSGVRAGVAANIPVVGITSGQPAAVLMAAGASFVIKDYNDPILWQLLKP